jgi:TolB protein
MPNYSTRWIVILLIIPAWIAFLSACSAGSTSPTPNRILLTGTIVTSTPEPIHTLAGTLSIPQISPWPSLALTLLPSPLPLSNSTAQTTMVTYPPQQGLLVYSAWTGAKRRIWLSTEGIPQPFAVTPESEDAHDPEISQDGKRIAYVSHRDGKWEVYMLSLADGSSIPLTHSNDFTAYPTWSPDSQFIAYEHYINGHFQICIMPVSGSSPNWCGPDNLEAFEPKWSSQGRTIIFTGISRPQNQTDLFSIDLNSMAITNITNTSDLNEHRPVFSPDSSQIAYAVQKGGYNWIETVSANPIARTPTIQVQGDWPVWDADGSWLAGVYQPTVSESYLLFYPSNHSVAYPPAQRIPQRVDRISWSGASLPNPWPQWLQTASADVLVTGVPTATFGGPLSHSLMSITVTAPDPRLSDSVTDRFNDLRKELQNQAGWDYLKTLDSAAVAISTPLAPGNMTSWLRTGRAFAVARDAMAKGWLLVVPETQGSFIYWRLFLRTAVQDGTQGEPLRNLPWDFGARTSSDPAAVNQGGTFMASIPTGYFIDFTQIAASYDWQREPADANWRSYYPGIRYWEFYCPDGLNWHQAMNEIYPLDTFLTATPSNTPTPWPTYNWGPQPTDTRWPSPTLKYP